ncbi:hypothetical protein CC80DRAFT_487785 [Byssothecium circinans]|uniref:BZIP domain-containing protein n=1 Tax=Byssothecium circinans TaxID=147558 RepID=A0A6A5UAU3_9PLEO|nr:hypothetical protein CC80DRAFT_487785 [Byssothecium circinans]
MSNEPHDGSNSNATPQTPPPTNDAHPPPPVDRRPSSSRAIVPFTRPATGLNLRGSTATTSSSVDTNPKASPVGGGPTSSSYVIPPRPKPGRKPATDEPASKRKAQNRESQRAFRARKVAKHNEMQAYIERVELKHQEEMNRMLDDIHKLTQRCRKADADVASEQKLCDKYMRERDFWKEQSTVNLAHIQKLELQLAQQNHALNPFADKQTHSTFFQSPFSNSSQNSPTTRGSITSFTGYHTPKMDGSCGNCGTNGECACVAEHLVSPMHPMTSIPPLRPPTAGSVSSAKAPRIQSPVNAYAAQEIDFTTQWMSRRGVQSQQPEQAHHPASQFLSDTDQSCGFCTDVNNCMCRGPSLNFQDMTRNGCDTDPPSASGGRRTVPTPVTTVPGSCPDCQANPNQKAWCQRVAKLRNSADNISHASSSRNSSIGSALETMEPYIPDASLSLRERSIGCSEAYKLFEGRYSMDQDKMDWIGNLKTIPSSAPRKYSALELDTAAVIATLGNTMQPLQERVADAPNGHIVRAARDRQMSAHTTGSPMNVSSVMNNLDSSPRKWR